MSRENAQAALAQSVERRLGKAEVGGSDSARQLIYLRSRVVFPVGDYDVCFFVLVHV